MAIIANDSANTKAIIMAVKILGALEGFLPTALILAKLPAAKTAQGPKIHNAKIIISAKLRLTFFHNDGYFILVYLYNSPFYRKSFFINK